MPKHLNYEITLLPLTYCCLLIRNFHIFVYQRWQPGRVRDADATYRRLGDPAVPYGNSKSL